MPELDRQIMLRITATTTNQQGEPVDVVTEYPTWAQLRQDQVARSPTEGGILSSAMRVWRIRYQPDIASALDPPLVLDDKGQPIAQTLKLEIQDGVNRQLQSVDNLGEPAGFRRQYIDLAVKGATG